MTREQFVEHYIIAELSAKFSDVSVTLMKKYKGEFLDSYIKEAAQRANVLWESKCRVERSEALDNFVQKRKEAQKKCSHSPEFFEGGFCCHCGEFAKPK